MQTAEGHDVKTPMASRVDNVERSGTVFGFRPEFAVMMRGNLAWSSASTIESTAIAHEYQQADIGI